MRKLLTYCILLLLSSSPLLAQDCNASFYAEQDPECINCFHFTNTSHSNLNSNIHFTWDMGDGSIYHTEDADHQFSSANTFNVKLNIEIPICTGILQISADGGVPPYEFQWSNGYTENSDSLSIQDSLCPGNYHITITDAMNDSLVQNIVLSDMTGIDLSIDIEYVNCLSEYPNSCIGELTAVPQGGIPPYTFSWNTGSTEPHIENLCPGEYQVTVCDANGLCESETIRLPVFECGVESFTAPSSGSSCDGNIEFTVNGGIYPYSFSWSQNIDYSVTNYSSYAEELCEGTYIIQVTDANGAQCEDKVQLGVLSTDIMINSPSTANNCDASVTANPMLGTPPYSFYWSTGSTEQSIEDLCEGWYYLTVCDAGSNCTTDSIEIINLPLNNNINWRGPSGPGACDGYIYAYTNGGYPPYTYSWEPDISSLNGYDFTLTNGLCSGTYILTTCDSGDNCITDTIVMSDKPFNVNINYSNPSNGECNGKIYAEASGASAPYNFLWSNGEECLYQTECYLGNLCPGTYYVTICDFENNCVVDSVTLLELPTGPEIINTNLSLSTPENACNGSAVIEAVGQEPLQFFWSCESWSDGNVSGIENQCPGIYYVTICDNNNICTTDSIELIRLYGNFTFTQNPYNSLCNGQLSYQPIGGYPPYDLEWSTGSDQSHISGLCPGWYYITVSDEFGNSSIDSIELENMSIPPLESGYIGLQAATIMDYCTDIATQEISTDYFTSIRGHVYFGNNLLPEGVMVFFTEQDDIYNAKQVCKIQNGFYRIEQLQQAEYYALAIPVFSPEYEYFPIYYPTYFGDSMSWENATKIILYDSIPKDIHLCKSETIKHGRNQIKGQLIYEDDAIYEENIFLSNWYFLDPPGAPHAGLARHIPVYLTTEDGTLLKYQLTNHKGEFEFNHLQEGNYSLHFEKPGYTSHYHLHNTKDSTTDIVYVMYESDIDLLSTGINETEQNPELSLYPNPATDLIYLKHNITTNASRIRIKIYSSEGRMVMKKETEITENPISLPLKNLPKGLLLIKLEGENINLTRKVMHR